MADTIALNALDRKRGEIVSELLLAEQRIVDLKEELRAVERVMRLMGYDGELPSAKPRKQSTRLFSPGEISRAVYDLQRERPDLRINRDIALEIIRRKGWETSNYVLWGRVANAVKDVRKKRARPVDGVPGEEG